MFNHKSNEYSNIIFNDKCIGSHRYTRVIKICNHLFEFFLHNVSILIMSLNNFEISNMKSTSSWYCMKSCVTYSLLLFMNYICFIRSQNITNYYQIYLFCQFWIFYFDKTRELNNPEVVVIEQDESKQHNKTQSVDFNQKSPNFK